MNDSQYGELLGAIVDLRNATEAGFQRVDRRFDTMEEHWQRRHAALENRLEEMNERGERRLDGLETRFDGLETRVDGLEKQVDGLGTRVDTGFRALSSQFEGFTVRLISLEQR